MSEAPTHEDLQRKVARIADQAGDLPAKLQFTSVVDALSRSRGQLQEISDDLGRVRAKGYLYKSGLEAQLAGAADAAPGVAQELQQETRRVAGFLDDRVDDLVRRARRLAVDSDLTNDTARIDVLEDAYRDIDKEVKEAERRVKAISAPVTKAISDVQKAVKEAVAIVDAFEGSSFDLQQGENPVAVVEATWEDARSGAKKGKLFLSDMRILFEHDEEIVTKKKFIFFAAEKERVQQLLLDQPIGHLASSDDSTRGWVMKDQIVALSWDGSAGCPRKTTFELDSGTAETWDALIESIKDGTISSDKVDGTPEVAAVLQFPAQCGACSGALPAAVRGQQTLTCPYCATVANPL